ncbi:hypothetical protein DYB37_010195 [Aphanomyces astaci]|uniref:Uncharacterized protein n=1 Tax=Aphanomyces astaci TaxID=112090 RepID=A0A397BTY6_APHAT|nr:hypothetical protein DYB25_008041 [Aphanomyces astaci]RHY43072.1 hypothetical protein DYB34_004835 [Aphanomyces astaci]RHY43399.1 hypothetical protein DYB38_006251 [Aphanomyces astaci]RHY57690.1 hypothetical protein DYB30_006446 [Aphanomyces astaci]RHY92918.1 hypothetical protein DYB35_007293 [Aphanomyces astaci]
MGSSRCEQCIPFPNSQPVSTMKLIHLFAAAAASTVTLATTTTVKPVATSAPIATSAGVCKLQFTSVCSSDTECGDLNGFNMTCIKSGSNKLCGCLGGKDKCQIASTSADVAFQFDECTDQRRCVRGNGFTALTAEDTSKVCQEPLFCVREQNPDPVAVLKSQCHTCGSCTTQNVKNKDDGSLMRYDCAKICPTAAPTTVAPTTDPTDAPTTKASKSTTTAAPGSPGAVVTPVPSSAALSSLAIGVALAVVAAVQIAM